MAEIPRSDGPSSSANHAQLRRNVDALRGLSISVPARILSLIEQEDPPVLAPGPCQEQHSLAAALDSIGIEATTRLTTLDPTFDLDSFNP